MAKLWPNSAKFVPNLDDTGRQCLNLAGNFGGRRQLKSGQSWPTFGRTLIISGPILSFFHRIWPESTTLGRNRPKCAADVPQDHICKCRQRASWFSWPEFGRLGIDEFGPNSAGLGPKPATFDPNSAKHGPSRPKLARDRPNLTEFDQTWPDIGEICLGTKMTRRRVLSPTGRSHVPRQVGSLCDGGSESHGAAHPSYCHRR